MAEDGDEILIRPGTYVEAVVIDKDITVSGEGPRDKIVITAPDGGPEAAIRDDRFRTEPYAVQLLRTSATLSNATLAGERSLVHATGGSPTVTGLHFVSVGTPGWLEDKAGSSIMVSAGSTATIRDNTIAGGGSIAVFDLSEPIIEANTRVGGAHIWGGYGDGAVIRGNTIDGSLASGISLRNPASMTIEGNVISNPSSYGVEIRDGSPAVEDNTVSGASIAAVSVGGVGEATLRGNRLIGNGMAISWSGTEGLIERNAVEGNRAGIVIAGGSPVVRDNTVEGTETRGIAVLGGATPILSGNTSCDNGRNLYIVDGAAPEDDGTNEICEDAVTE